MHSGKLNWTQLNWTKLGHSVQFSFPLCTEPATRCDDHRRFSTVDNRRWPSLFISANFVAGPMHSGMNSTELNSSVEFNSVCRCALGLTTQNTYTSYTGTITACRWNQTDQSQHCLIRAFPDYCDSYFYIVDKHWEPFNQIKLQCANNNTTGVK